MNSWLENYRVPTRDAVKFRFVEGSNDEKMKDMSFVIFLDKSSPGVYVPKFTHQIFGFWEKVFGFRKLQIGLLFCQQSLHCHYSVLKKEKVPTRRYTAPDKIDKMIKYFIPPEATKDIYSFRKLSESYKLECHGTMIHHFKHIDGLDYVIHRVDVKSENFLKFFARLETIIYWYIDGASKIDVSDPNWTVYLLYRDTVVIGYCTVYKFTLENGLFRKRISQFFIMPPQQRLHLGTTFLRVVYNELLVTEMKEVAEVIVELPCEDFQSLKDYLDLEHYFAGTEFLLKPDGLAHVRLQELKALYYAKTSEDFLKIKKSILNRIHLKSKNLRRIFKVDLHPDVLIEQYMNTLRHYARTCRKFEGRDTQ